MSLKARIEAVIYAAEEPVTLAVLASLFREEALSTRAERLAAVAPDADADSEREAPAEERPTEPPDQNFADAELAAPGFAGESQPPSETTAGEGMAAAQAQPVDATVPPPETADPEREAQAGRALARQRDREVRDEIRRLVDELLADYAAADRGVEIREVAGGYRMATRPEYHDAVRAFVKSLKPPMKLSLQALETLAVIAYKQPVTVPEIGDIRGVDSSGVLASLIARKLIATAGRKQVIGRPILYKTTREFLLRFGLKDLNDLPSTEEFEKMAGELAEIEEESAPATPDELPFAEDEAVEQAAQELQAAEAISAEISDAGEAADEREEPQP